MAKPTILSGQALNGLQLDNYYQKPIKLAREPCLVLWLKRKMEEIHILSV